MNAEEERIEGQEVENLQGEESDFVEEADAENLTEVDDDDEDVCRVCRCPAEPGRPLFTPCKCSGSMGMTHQDCLTSWLEVTRGDGEYQERSFCLNRSFSAFAGRSHASCHANQLR